MRKTITVAAISAVVTVLAIGGLALLTIGGPGLAFAQSVGAAHWGGPGWGGPPWRHQGPPPYFVQVLRDIPEGERFGHIQHFQLKITDKDNSPVVIDGALGTVKSVSGSSLELELTAGGTATYQLDGSTSYYGHASNAGEIKSGDRALVSTVNGAGTATAVVDLADGSWIGPGH